MKIIDFAYECWMEDRNMDNSLVDYVAFILNATKELGHNLDYLFNTNVIDVIHYYNEENNITELFKYAILDLWKNNIVTSCSLKGHLYMRNIIVNYLTEQGRNSTFKKAIDNYEKYCQSHYILGREIERKFGKQDFDVNIFDFDKEYLDEQKIEKPVLFQETLEELSRLLVEAYSTKSSIDITYYEQNQIYKINGIIIKIDTLNNTLKLESGSSEFMRFKCESFAVRELIQDFLDFYNLGTYYYTAVICEMIFIRFQASEKEKMDAFMMESQRKLYYKNAVRSRRK